jgi:hypothetical protein
MCQAIQDQGYSCEPTLIVVRAEIGAGKVQKMGGRQKTTLLEEIFRRGEKKEAPKKKPGKKQE